MCTDNLERQLIIEELIDCFVAIEVSLARRNQCCANLVSNRNMGERRRYRSARSPESNQHDESPNRLGKCGSGVLDRIENLHYESEAADIENFLDHRSKIRDRKASVAGLGLLRRHHQRAQARARDVLDLGKIDHDGTAGGDRINQLDLKVRTGLVIQTPDRRQDRKLPVLLFGHFHDSPESTIHQREGCTARWSVFPYVDQRACAHGHTRYVSTNRMSMQRDTPPFRADHVGSLLRTREVLQARDDRQHGRISDTQLRAIEDAAIRMVVKMQEDIGLRGVTDGEYRRASWHMDFLYQIGGVI